MSNELGCFLRARRTDSKLEPASPSLGSRRVSGLRREEVAAAAGISVDYYTRLEQGRESNPSDSVLQAVSRVLKLEQDAIDHLFRLRATNGSPQLSAVADAEGLERAEALVGAVRPNPAYVLDRLSNVVATNPEGLALFDGLDQIPAEQRNTCRYLMTNPRAREVFLDWEEIARGAVGHLRAANAENLGEPGLQEMVAALSAESPQFADWWSGHVVHRRRSAVQRIRTSDGTVIERRFEVLHLPDEKLRMTLWLP